MNTDTTMLSMASYGAYVRLLSKAEQDGVGVPASQVYEVAGARTKEDRAIVDDVLNRFFAKIGDRWAFVKQTCASPSRFQQPDPDVTKRKGRLCVALRKMGVDAAPHLPAWEYILSRYADDEILMAARLLMRSQSSRRVGLGYLKAVLDSMRDGVPAIGKSASDYGEDGAL